MVDRLLRAFWATMCVIWSVAMVGNAFAQPPLTITKAGYFITTVGPDGLPQHVQITQVIDLTDGTNPIPPEDGEFDPALVKQAREWATEIGDPMSAQAVAMVYSHIRTAVADGILTTDNVWPVLKLSTDSALATVASGKDWTTFRDRASAVVTEGRQRGTLQTAAQVQRLMLSFQHGVELSADGSDALPLDVMARIVQQTNEAIDAAR